MPWLSETNNFRISAVDIPLVDLLKISFIVSDGWKRTNRAFNIPEKLVVVSNHPLAGGMFGGRDFDLLQRNWFAWKFSFHSAHHDGFNL